jgi:putative hemolysin
MPLEFLLIFALILVNGFFAATEMALVTSRRHRLRSMQSQGKRAAQDVLQVKEKPGTYLATVQIGISLVGSLASAFGGLTAQPTIAAWLANVPVLVPYADELALLLIVLFITYLSLVFGELVPKQLALRNPEGLSVTFVRPVKILSRVAALPIRFLSFSADLVLGLLGPAPKTGPSTSSEEIKQMVQQGTAEGIFQISEGAFVSGVFEYADRKAAEVMTTRTEIVALDETLSPRDALDFAARSNHSRFPVYTQDLDHIRGYLHIKDLILAEPDTNLRDITRQVMYIPESAVLPNIYKVLIQERVHMAIVLDEFGGTAGLLTIEDLLEVIVGEIDDEYEIGNLETQKLGEDSWLLAGSIQLEDLGKLIGARFEANDAYTTVAGLLMAELGHVPTVGESLKYAGLRFTVRSMDNLRIERVLVQKEK